MITHFFSENPGEKSIELRLVSREKKGGDDTRRFADEFVANIDKLMEENAISKLNTKIFQSFSVKYD